jgi:rod shape-determining protein MreC
VLVVVVAICITLLTLDLRGVGGVTDTARDRVTDALAPANDAAERALQPVKDAVNGITRYDDLRAENQRLQAEVERLRVGEQATAGLRNQVDALRQLMDLPRISDLPAVYASVVGRAPSNGDRTVQIDKGRDDGIEPGFPVVVGGSVLVGRVVEASARRASIRLVTDAQFSVGVKLVGDREIERGVATGDGGNRLSVSLIDPREPVMPGYLAVTGGPELKSMFPAELVVGTVAAVDVEPGELSQRVSVRPSLDVSGLEFVAVLLYRPPAG